MLKGHVSKDLLSLRNTRQCIILSSIPVCIFCHGVILAVSAWIDVKLGLCTAVISDM